MHIIVFSSIGIFGITLLLIALLIAKYCEEDSGVGVGVLGIMIMLISIISIFIYSIEQYENKTTKRRKYESIKINN